MSAWMGYHAVPVPYVRHERKAGSSKYSFKKCSSWPWREFSGFPGGL